MGGGVRLKAEKKIVSVGAISTFRHPLDYNDAASLEGLCCGLGWIETAGWLNNMENVSNLFNWHK